MEVEEEPWQCTYEMAHPGIIQLFEASNSEKHCSAPLPSLSYHEPAKIKPRDPISSFRSVASLHKPSTTTGNTDFASNLSVRETTVQESTPVSGTG